MDDVLPVQGRIEDRGQGLMVVVFDCPRCGFRSSIAAPGEFLCRCGGWLSVEAELDDAEAVEP